MEEKDIKSEIERLKNIKGKARGIAIKSHADFIVEEKGKEGLKKLENKMEEMGFPIKYEEMKPMDFYPLHLEYATFLAIQDLFSFSKEKLREMGVFQTKISLIVKLFMKYFGSVNMLIKEIPKMWGKYYTVGELEVISMDMAQKRCVIQLKNYTGYPPQCRGFEGYFSYIAKMAMNKQVTCKENKCVYKGDDYHEFTLKWE